MLLKPERLSGLSCYRELQLSLGLAAHGSVVREGGKRVKGVNGAKNTLGKKHCRKN